MVASQVLSPPPTANFHCSPFGSIRMINNLNWLVKKSIDEFVSPDDFSLTYTSVDYFSISLAFGRRSSMYLYNQFADTLEYIAKNRGSSELLDHYMDNSFTVQSSAKFLWKSDIIFQETANVAGWELQRLKCTLS